MKQMETIHTLGATMPTPPAQQQPNGKQHPMQFQLINQHQQPLVSQQQQQQQSPNVQMLQFHHHLQQHPYATLHHQSLQQQTPASQLSPNATSAGQQANYHQINLTNGSQTMHFNSNHHHLVGHNQSSHHLNNLNQTLLNQHLPGHHATSHHNLSSSSSSAATSSHLNNNTTNHHHHNQQQQQQQQQHQQYNNSDYSSSTYHIYDQISDLIIIKQQRMERKRQLERRRKVILFCLAAILLVGTLLFLLIQSIVNNSASSSSASSLSSAFNNNNNNNINGNELIPTPAWAPPGVLPAKPNDPFDGSQINMNNKVIHQLPLDQRCSGQGQIVISPIDGLSHICKCRPGFFGDKCQEFLGLGHDQQLLARCSQVNCNNNGKCNQQGLCKCYPGFIGNSCEFRMPSIGTINFNNNNNQPDSSKNDDNLQAQQPSQPDQSSPMQQPSDSTSNSEQQQHANSVPVQQQQLCPNNCNGNGRCISSSGQCLCSPGYSGDSCQEQDLCYGRLCSGQGVCLQASGECQCQFGYKGLNCENRDDEQWARLLNCSNHGKYDSKSHKCLCDQGFNGYDCNNDESLGAGIDCPTISFDCGPSGLFDCSRRKCICQDGFTGDRCQLQSCSGLCLRNGGQCNSSGQCSCPAGRYGRHCSLNGCPNFCSGRGQCVRVANSNHFYLQPTNNLQQEELEARAEWRCACQPGSAGKDCSLPVEHTCDDGIDNDQDGLVDCADSECCGDKFCQNSTLCLKSPDPLDILMRKQPPPPTSSFFQRMQFLIEKQSSQYHTSLKDFNDSILASKYVNRASVVRGKVTYLKQGVTGVRVSVAGQINLGIALTRDGGHFDLLVNGGGAVVLEFRREPFASTQKTVRVPWNEIVLMDSVELQLASPGQPGSAPDDQLALPANDEPEAPICTAHNYRLLRPQIKAAPKSSRRSHSASRLTSSGKLITSSSQQQVAPRAVILKESAMVQHSIQLPNSANNNQQQQQQHQDSQNQNQSVSLVYISSRANEFMSTINIQLTPPSATNLLDLHQQHQANKLPDDLKLIHLKIIVEGNLFEQTFEPQMNLSFTYAWNRRNVYRQKSFGLSTASISVGYEYFDCKQVIWSTKHIQLAGHDLSISDIGSSWNLNIHHRFNYRDSILQRGDGLNFNLKTDKPKIVQPIMGDGYQRQLICPYCDGATGVIEQRLHKPLALVSGPDGSLYIGDYNLVRRIDPPQTAAASSSSGQASERVVRTVLELPANKVPSKYSLALSSSDQRLYMTDTDRHQIHLIREQGKQQASAELQQFNDSSSFAAGLSSQAGSSDEASLLAVVGTGHKCQLDDRTNCGDGQLARSARLIEPKSLVFDLSNRMYIADGPNVRMVDVDQKIYTILGDYKTTTRHSNGFSCSAEPIAMHKFVPSSPVDLAINPLDNTLHVLDDNVVYKITQDKRVQIVAGRLAHCSSSQQPSSGQQQQQQQQQQRKQLRATEVYLQSAQSIVFNQNGDLFISEDEPKSGISRVSIVSPEDDTISLYAGLPVEVQQTRSTSGPLLTPTVDSIHLDDEQQASSSMQAQLDKQRSSNVLPISQPTRANDYKFTSVASIAVDQQGNLIVADKVQLRILSIEPDLPQLNGAGEYELQSPDNLDELLVFNRHGHHIATRDLSAGHSFQRPANKYTFSYNVNTSFGQLLSIGYLNGNKLSIYRDGPQHTVKMIETAFGGQCKLDISPKTGQVHSISTSGSSSTKTNLSYQIEGGLLRSSRDSQSGEVFEFTYDEFGRANGISHSTPRQTKATDCRLHQSTSGASSLISRLMNQQCAALIVAE